MRAGTEGNQALYKQYLSQLDEYPPHFGTKDKCDAPKPFIGWKIHLNVSPQNVTTVSRFLLEHDFTHKYINQGNIDLGKVFTVYLGSKILSERLIKEIYDSVGYYLEEPKSLQEILVAPRIVARFATQMHPDFIGNYCYKGLPAKKYWETDDKEELYQISKEALTRTFGDYFGRGLEFYQPDPDMILPGEQFEDFLKRTAG